VFVTRHVIGIRAALAALIFCTFAHAGHCADTQKITDPGTYLALTEPLASKNHQEFTERLARIHRESPTLSASQRWYLRYLDAFEYTLKGDYVAAEPLLRDVINHSNDPILAPKAASVLISNLAVSRHYEDAFTIAYQLMIELPRIRDRMTRYLVLINLSQMFNFAGQTDLAVKYARLAGSSIPPGKTDCNPRIYLVAALWDSPELTSSNPELSQAIDACRAADQPIMLNAALLIQTSRFLREARPRHALAALDKMAASIKLTNYFNHELSEHVQRAQAYEQLGRDDDARQAALAAVAMTKPGDINDYLKDAYEVLYRIEKKHGNTAAALDDYEHYVTQDMGYLNDVSARTLAYQTVQQQVLTRKLETEELSKQNSILRLQQALNAKAVEASRLYIALLLMTLASIVIWLYRVKRSQLRFKKLSCQDGLTGIMNHQHFVSEAHRVLHQLDRRHANACLVSIDLDHFKKVNDSHGHAMGDAVLKSAVAVCQQQLRPSDLFGRLGGEEFGILLQDCDRGQGLEIADRIRLAISLTPIESDDCAVSISASVGLACTDSSGYDLQRLCIDADDALYRAKRAGRNRVIANIADSELVSA